MSISAEDITLENFLKKFTYTGDPNAGSKTQISLDIFLSTVSSLRISDMLDRLRRAIRR